MKRLNINKFGSVSGAPSDNYPSTKWDSEAISQFITSHIRESYSQGIRLGSLRFFMENAMNGYLSKSDLEEHLISAGYRCIKDSNDLAEKVYNIRTIGIYQMHDNDEVPSDGAIFVDTRGHMVKRY